MCRSSIQIPPVHPDRSYPSVDFANSLAPPDDVARPLPTKCVWEGHVIHSQLPFVFIIFKN